VTETQTAPGKTRANYVLVSSYQDITDALTDAHAEAHGETEWA
jgi:hypothetical protein